MLTVCGPFRFRIRLRLMCRRSSRRRTPIKPWERQACIWFTVDMSLRVVHPRKTDGQPNLAFNTERDLPLHLRPHCPTPQTPDARGARYSPIFTVFAGFFCQHLPSTHIRGSVFHNFMPKYGGVCGYTLSTQISAQQPLAFTLAREVNLCQHSVHGLTGDVLHGNIVHEEHP